MECDCITELIRVLEGRTSKKRSNFLIKRNFEGRAAQTSSTKDW